MSTNLPSEGNKNQFLFAFDLLINPQKYITERNIMETFVFAVMREESSRGFKRAYFEWEEALPRK